MIEIAIVIAGFFGLGLIVGSFLNVVIIRGASDEPITGRSHCRSCGATLRPIDLVPVISYLLSRGRCRYCHARISSQYVLVELLTAISFAVIAWNVAIVGYMDVIRASLYAVIVSVAIAIGGIDLRTTYIPDRLSYLLAALSLLSVVVTYGLTPSWQVLIAGPLIAFPLAALWLVSRGTWIGLGDAKLALSMGWLFGITGGLTALVLSFWIGAAVSLTLLFLHKLTSINRGGLLKRIPGLTMKSEVPFAPFLILGMAAVAATGFDLIAALS